MAVTFNVTMGAEQMEGKDVLVFLRSENPRHSDHFHAWQVLDGSAGASESFSYDSTISVNVTTVGATVNDSVTSDTLVVEPGILLQAVSAEDASLKLEDAPESLAKKKLSSRKAGVINATEPFVQFDCNWCVNDKPVVTAMNIDKAATSTFGLEPALYFMVGEAPLVGQAYTDELFAGMTRYELSSGATSVEVAVSNNQGAWEFSFTEGGES